MRPQVEALPRAAIAPLVRAALEEDGAFDDATTLATVPADLILQARLLARAEGVLAGRDLAACAWGLLAADAAIHLEGLEDGQRLHADTVVFTVHGPARVLLAGERVALNFLQRLSGIATLTAHFVDAVAGTGALITDTRKTTPGLRRLEKYAVRCGGGANHRASLSDMLLVKENHIAAAGSVEAALRQAKVAARGRVVEIELRSLDEFRRALPLAPERVLLDHWTPEAIREAVAWRGSAERPEIEVSGNLDLEHIRRYALPGVRYLSVGALTHSAPALDLSLLVEGLS